MKRAGSRPWNRDPIDERIVRDFRRRAGRIIDSQDEVGGYPKYDASYRKLDVPTDGLEAWLESYYE